MGTSVLASRPPEEAHVRDRLIEVAARHFAEHGVQGASQRAIQREVGVNNSTANYYFGSKDALYRAVVDTALSRVQAQRQAALDALSPSLTHDERALALLDAYLGALLKEAETETGYNYLRLVVHLHLIVPDAAVDVLEERLTPIRELYVNELAKLFPDASRNRIYEVLRLSVSLAAVAPMVGQKSLSAKTIARLTREVVTVATIAFEKLCSGDTDED